jgi:hypothetical protein
MGVIPFDQADPQLHDATYNKLADPANYVIIWWPHIWVPELCKSVQTVPLLVLLSNQPTMCSYGDHESGA